MADCHGKYQERTAFRYSWFLVEGKRPVSAWEILVLA